MGVRSYLLAEMVEADHASRGSPSGDVFRAKSSTVVSISLRVGSFALASPATTVGEISVMKLQYSSADLNLSSPTTCFTAMSFRPPLRKAVSINPGAAHRNNPGDPGGGVGIATCSLITPVIVVVQGFFSGASQTAAHTRPRGLATRANSFTLTSTSGKNMKPNLHNTASNELSGKGRALASHCLV